MKNLMQQSALVLVVGLVTACASPNKINVPLNNVHQSTHDTRIFLRQSCIVSKKGAEAFPVAIAALIGAIAPKAIEKTIDLSSAYLKKLKDNYTGSESNRGATFVFTKTDETNPIRPSFGCLTIVRGEFGTNREMEKDKCCSLETNQFWQDHKDSLQELGLVASPEFYFEANVAYATDRPSFRLQPQFFEFAKPTAKWTRGAWNGKGQKDVNIILAFETPLESAKDVDNERFGSATFAFRKVKIGTRLTGLALQGLSSAWIDIPQVDQKMIEKVDRGKGVLPISVLATVQDSENGGDVFVAVSETLEGSKDQLTQALTDLIKKATEQKEKGKDEGK